jgi:plastocyanin
MLFPIFLLYSCAGKTGEHTPKSYTVEIKQMKFQPADLTIQKGDTVVWINKDIVSHDVTEESNKAWTSSLMPVGESWSLVVNESADYYCSIHVVMKGRLIVQ